MLMVMLMILAMAIVLCTQMCMSAHTHMFDHYIIYLALEWDEMNTLGSFSRVAFFFKHVLIIVLVAYTKQRCTNSLTSP